MGAQPAATRAASSSSASGVWSQTATAVTPAFHVVSYTSASPSGKGTTMSIVNSSIARIL